MQEPVQGQEVMSEHPALNVFSFGGGVQTTAMMIMCCKGELKKPDKVIFADTQWETKATYNYIKWMEREWMNPNGIELIRVTTGDIRADSLDEDKGFASMPFKTIRKDNSKGMLMRQCTNEYKVQPIYRALRKILGLVPKERYKGTPVNMWMGISWDEMVRMKTNRVKWINNVYPLIEKRMSRNDCVNYMTKNGVPTPPKSACIGCPFHGDSYWRDLKINSRNEFDDAVHFERNVNKTKVAIKGEVYIHKSCKPLDQVDFGESQQEMFEEECEGHCGV